MTVDRAVLVPVDRDETLASLLDADPPCVVGRPTPNGWLTTFVSGDLPGAVDVMPRIELREPDSVTVVVDGGRDEARTSSREAAARIAARVATLLEAPDRAEALAEALSARAGGRLESRVAAALARPELGMQGVSASVLAIRARPRRVSSIVRVTGATGRVVDLSEGWIGFVPEDPQDLAVTMALPALRGTAAAGVHEPAVRLSRAASGCSMAEVAGPALLGDGPVDPDNVVGWQWRRDWVVVGAGEEPGPRRGRALDALTAALAPAADEQVRRRLDELLARDEPELDPLVALCELLGVPTSAVDALEEGPRPPRRGLFRRRR